MQYIDADLLRKEIEKNKQMIDGLFTEGDDSVYDGEDDAYNRVLRIIDSLQQGQPSLPDNLDEAAEKYAWQKEEPLAEGERLSAYFNQRIEAYKTGAEWMAEQGVSTVAISSTEYGITEEGMKLIGDYLDSLPDKTEVVLQIRKKQ